VDIRSVDGFLSLGGEVLDLVLKVEITISIFMNARFRARLLGDERFGVVNELDRECERFEKKINALGRPLYILYICPKIVKLIYVYS
jgi:hypothetical protein